LSKLINFFYYKFIYELLKTILQGKVLVERGPGKRRTSWLKNLRTWFSKTTTELIS
jgi:hypothetical protein